jgi:hypothetical protein
VPESLVNTTEQIMFWKCHLMEMTGDSEIMEGISSHFVSMPQRTDISSQVTRLTEGLAGVASISDGGESKQFKCNDRITKLDRASGLIGA